MSALRSMVITHFITTMADSDFHLFFSDRLCFSTCFQILFSQRNKWISWVPHITLQTRRRLQPRHLIMTRIQIYLVMFCCLPRPETCRLMRTHFFGATAFTFRFRLECFAVYASSPLLPPETQDSLRSGAGFTFYDGTFTRKIDATSCRTQDTCANGSLHFKKSLQPMLHMGYLQLPQKQPSLNL